MQEPGDHTQDKQLNLFPIEKKYTAKQISLIDNEIELDALVEDMKVARGKWKAMTKRLEKLKKSSDAHQYDPTAEDYWAPTIVWRESRRNLHARGVRATQWKHALYYENKNLILNVKNNKFQILIIS